MARAWGVGIAPNRLIDHARRNKKMAFVALQDSPSGRDMETATVDRMAMREALASLKVDERDLLAMRVAGRVRRARAPGPAPHEKPPPETSGGKPSLISPPLLLSIRENKRCHAPQ